MFNIAKEIFDFPKYFLKNKINILSSRLTDNYIKFKYSNAPTIVATLDFHNGQPCVSLNNKYEYIDIHDIKKSAKNIRRKCAELSLLLYGPPINRIYNIVLVVSPNIIFRMEMKDFIYFVSSWRGDAELFGQKAVKYILIGE